MRPENEEYAASWDGEARVWRVTVFPSTRPSGREQVGHLRECLNRMLQAETAHHGLPAGASLLDVLDAAPDADAAVYRRGAPDTFDPTGLIRDLKRIRGESTTNEDVVKVPGFDHAKGDPEPDAHVFDRLQHEVVICEGLYLLHDGDGWGAVKGLLDYSIFLDSDLEVCVQRIKIRNQCIPGYTVEEILERAEKVDRVNAKIVLQSKPYADLIVQSLASQKATLETS